MINVDAVSDQLSPIRNALLVDDEIDRVGSVPGFEKKMLIEVFVLRRWIPVEEGRRLIHQEKFSIGFD